MQITISAGYAPPPPLKPPGNSPYITPQAAETRQMNDSEQPEDAPQRGQAETPAADAPPDDLRAQLEAAEQRAAANEDKWLRARAETENLRKRGERDLEQARKYAVEVFALEMLAVKDSLELALHGGGEGQGGEHREGVELTLKVLQQVFDKFGIEEVNPQGEVFNPDRHQAMMTQPGEGRPPGTVLSVMQKGYLLCGRLLRPAMVAVAGAAPAGPVDGAENTENRQREQDTENKQNQPDNDK